MAIRWVLFDWGDTLMHETGGPADVPMADWPEVRALDGALAVVSSLAQRRRVGVATNATVSDRAHVERALERVGLRAFVSEVFCHRELGCKKDDARFWDAVVARTGVGRDEIVMVGDDLAADVLAPRRAGIASVWLNWKRAPGGEAPVIERLDELPRVIDRFERGPASR